MAIDMASKGFVPLTVELLSCADVAVKRLALGVFANFASFDRSQQVLVEQGIIYQLVTYLEQAGMSRFALLCLRVAIREPRALW
jgi:hypothetical protein